MQTQVSRTLQPVVSSRAISERTDEMAYQINVSYMNLEQAADAFQKRFRASSHTCVSANFVLQCLGQLSVDDFCTLATIVAKANDNGQGPSVNLLAAVELIACNAAGADAV